MNLIHTIHWKENIVSPLTNEYQAVCTAILYEEEDYNGEGINYSTYTENMHITTWYVFEKWYNNHNIPSSVAQ